MIDWSELDFIIKYYDMVIIYIYGRYNHEQYASTYIGIYTIVTYYHSYKNNYDQIYDR